MRSLLLPVGAHFDAKLPRGRITDNSLAQYIKQSSGAFRTVAWPGQNRMPGWSIQSTTRLLELECTETMPASIAFPIRISSCA